MVKHRGSTSSAHAERPVLGSSWRSNSPLAGRVLAEDIAACSDDDVADTDAQNDLGTEHHGAFMYRRPSGVAYGGARPALNPQTFDEPAMTPLERKQSRHAERSLLRDNHVLPPKHAQHSQTWLARSYRRVFGTKVPASPGDEERAPTESDPLLGGRESIASASSYDDDVDEAWEHAIAEHRIKTTWQRETKTIITYSTPLIITFFLQYTINVTSIFAVGRIGKMELGAVSLANMSAAITCIGPFQGLATSLDTLCSQAYGSGHKHLVGLQFQRMTYFLLLLSLPIMVLWVFADRVLARLVPEPESAQLAGLYLRIMIFSIPGFILFEAGKRFTQAQGLFRATTYVLLICAPFNVFLSWLLVWKLEYGFVGAPIAVVITNSLLPLFLFLYVRFVDGSQCWGGFSRRALTNWGVMIRLALPGMIMVEAEWLAFEIMTIMAASFGTEYLAAQSVISTLETLSYQIPFSISIASSTRIANLIGAGLVDAAKISALVSFAAHFVIGAIDLILFWSLRYYLPLLFTKDSDVAELVVSVIPILAVMQVLDSLAAGAGGLLRGIGRQSIGGPANLISFYLISLPLQILLGYVMDWRLLGLWVGVSVGTTCVAASEYYFAARSDWYKAAVEAASRNASD